MKKIIKILMILLIMCITTKVQAANYEMRELIPESIQTTIRGDIFLYKNIVYENGFIEFGRIQNQSSEEHALSISIGLFDKDHKNIGTINYCKESLLSQEEMLDYQIEVTSNYLAPDKTFKDIKYIAVLGENPNCRTTGSQDYIGRKVEDIGKSSTIEVNKDAKLFIKVLMIVIGILVLVFIYYFLFTNAFQNMNGDDVRRDYKNLNKKLEEERENQILKETPTEPEIKTEKSEEVLKQEQEEQNNQSSSLRDFYK